MTTSRTQTHGMGRRVWYVLGVSLLLLMAVPALGGAQEADVTVRLEGQNFVFVADGEENPVIEVEQGDTVRVELEVTQGFHDWVVDEFDAATQQVSAGETTTVEFEAGETGEFAYYCSVAGHRQRGMEGTLIVR